MAVNAGTAVNTAGSGYTPALSLHDVAVGYRGRALLSDVTLDIPGGSVLCLLGPNGVGKTTLFKAILGLLPTQAGSIRLGGRATSSMSRVELSRQVAYVPQGAEESFGYRVFDVVLLGRAAWLGWRGAPGPQDRDIVRDCLERLEIRDIAEANFMELSGGQRQLVLIARALAQQPQVLMMDEPTANLDLGNEARVLRAVRDLAAEGMTVVVTTHRPDHAFAVAHTAVLLQPQGTYRCGPVEEVLTAEAMRQAYGVEVSVAAASMPSGAQVMHCVPVL